jgi:uncharacterized protein (DUF305 family)
MNRGMLTTTTTLATILSAGALAVAGCGETNSGGSASDAPGNGADRSFAADMVPHHESAVEMATIAQKRGKSTFVTKLASSIISTQTKEIATLRAEDEGLATAGIKTGSLGVPRHMMGMDHDPAMLKTAKPFDKAFLEMMIPHHQGAIVMADAELKKGQDPQLKALARSIITAQQREIADMRRHLGAAAPATHGTTSMNHGGTYG